MNENRSGLRLAGTQTLELTQRSLQNEFRQWVVILPGLIFSSNDLGLSFDIAVHAGTLMAVIYFFRSELALMTKSVFINESIYDKYKQLSFHLIIATLPIIFIGFIFSDLLEKRVFSEELIIAVSNLFFAAKKCQSLKPKYFKPKSRVFIFIL